MVLKITNTVPVEYLPNGPIKKVKVKTIKEITNSIKKLNFSVDFDGLILKKPILLPIEKDITKQGIDFDVYPISYDREFPDGTKLKFRGYLYNQKKSIYPPQFRGIIIRIKNTSIGDNIPDFLEYLYGEKQFLNWTFGEIYVEEGLEEAMNINRISFNITHQHYAALRSFLHEKLHKDVIVDCRIKYIERKKTEKKKLYTIRKAYLEKFISQFLKKDIKIIRSDRKSDMPIELKNKTLIIYNSHPIFKNFRKNQKEIVEDVLILFILTYKKSDGNLEKLKNDFINALSEWRYND
jgi:hypothetical protein